MSKDDRAVEPTETLAVVEAVVLEAEDEDADPAACTLCGGPVRMCGGTRRCLGGHLRPLERRWVTAIRLVYAGLCLTPTAAALWGGTLLRLAGLLTRGLAVSPAFVHTAAEYANPGGALPGEVAARLAVMYLQHRDVDRLDELFRSLRDADAPWLVDLRLLGPRAALSTPLDHARFASSRCRAWTAPRRPRRRLSSSMSGPTMPRFGAHSAAWSRRIHCRCGSENLTRSGGASARGRRAWLTRVTSSTPRGCVSKGAPRWTARSAKRRRPATP